MYDVYMQITCHNLEHSTTTVHQLVSAELYSTAQWKKEQRWKWTFQRFSARVIIIQGEEKGMISKTTQELCVTLKTRPGILSLLSVPTGKLKNEKHVNFEQFDCFQGQFA